MGPSSFFFFLEPSVMGAVGLLMGKVLACVAFLLAPSLNKRRNPGFVQVANTLLMLGLGFLGRTFVPGEFTSPCGFRFSLSPLPLKGFQT